MTNKLESPAHAFYAEVLKTLKESKFTFMVAGGFAVNAYTGLRRPTKDIDIFVKAFGSSNLVAPVTDDWFKDSKTARFFNCEVKIPSVTDLIWSKVFIQNRERYDGADVSSHTVKTPRN